MGFFGSHGFTHQHSHHCGIPRNLELPLSPTVPLRVACDISVKHVAWGLGSILTGGFTLIYSKGGVPKMGVSPNHFFLIGFSSINNPFWVPPFSGNTNLVTLLVLTQDVSIRDIIAWHPRLLVVSPFWTADFRALLLRYPFLSLKTGLQPLFVVESVCFLSLFDYSWMISLC